MNKELFVAGTIALEASSKWRQDPACTDRHSDEGEDVRQVSARLGINCGTLQRKT